MKKAMILLLLGFAVAQPALAGDESSGKKEGGKSETPERGVENGLRAVARGVNKGAESAVHGLRDASEWINKKAGQGGGHKNGKSGEEDK